MTWVIAVADGAILFLAVVFFISAVLKFRAPDDAVALTRRLLSRADESAIPLRVVRLVSGLELLISVGLLAKGPVFVLAAVSALGLSLSLTGAILVAIRSGVPCGCLGNASRSVATRADVARNAVLIVAASTATATALSRGSADLLRGVPVAALLLAASAVALWTRERSGGSSEPIREHAVSSSRRRFLTAGILGLGAGAVAPSLSPLHGLVLADGGSPSALALRARTDPFVNRLVARLADMGHSPAWDQAGAQRVTLPEDSSGLVGAAGVELLKVPLTSGAGALTWWAGLPLPSDLAAGLGVSTVNFGTALVAVGDDVLGLVPDGGVPLAGVSVYSRNAAAYTCKPECQGLPSFLVCLEGQALCFSACAIGHFLCMTGCGLNAIFGDCDMTATCNYEFERCFCACRCNLCFKLW